MEEDVTDLFNTEEATAELSDLSKEENRFEQSEGELLEVYAARSTRTASRWSSRPT